MKSDEFETTEHTIRALYRARDQLSVNEAAQEKWGHKLDLLVEAMEKSLSDETLQDGALT